MFNGEGEMIRRYRHGGRLYAHVYVYESRYTRWEHCKIETYHCFSTSRNLYNPRKREKTRLPTIQKHFTFPTRNLNYHLDNNPHKKTIILHHPQFHTTPLNNTRSIPQTRPHMKRRIPTIRRTDSRRENRISSINTKGTNRLLRRIGNTRSRGSIDGGIDSTSIVEDVVGQATMGAETSNAAACDIRNAGFGDGGWKIVAVEAEGAGGKA